MMDDVEAAELLLLLLLLAGATRDELDEDDCERDWLLEVPLTRPLLLEPLVTLLPLILLLLLLLLLPSVPFAFPVGLVMVGMKSGRFAFGAANPKSAGKSAEEERPPLLNGAT